MSNIYDLMVIGGGPGGYTSAILAAKKGASVILFEESSLGGTCLNIGCIPTKYLLDKAKLISKITKCSNQGLFKDAGMYSFQKIQQGKVEVVHKLVNGVTGLLKAHKVTVINGYAQLKPGLKAVCDGKEYQAKNIIIATGSTPIPLPIAGAEYTINSTDALEMKRPPASMVVIGGGVIGLEIASAYNALGSEVTVIEMLDRLYPAEEEKSIKKLVAALEQSGLRIITGAQVENIFANSSEKIIRYRKGEEVCEIKGDVVLSAIGRKANLNGMNPQELGLALNEKNEIVVDATMKTSIDHIYAIGDVIGNYQLAHVAYAEAACAVHNIFSGKKEMNYYAVPRCIYTLPGYAAVGMTSKQAMEAGLEIAIGNFHYTANGMALAEGQDGMLTVIAEQNSKETIGVHILGEGAPEMISLATLAVANKTTLQQWEDLIVAHPSLSEMVREAALDCFGEAVHGL
ncbi:MAG: dihydrolipoyl dehydrogenase [Lachnospiraceae bacterium]|nr:dihydrolipoyl dehydrogenase [Lachnospiraceae bacterium]